jgi:hypothetical protein
MGNEEELHPADAVGAFFAHPAKSLPNLSWDSRYEVAYEVLKRVHQTLTEYGPLITAGLVHYVNKQHRLQLRADHVIDSITMAGRPRPSDVERGRMVYTVWAPYVGKNRGEFFRTDEQVEAGVEAQVPAPINFEEGYYELYDRLQLARRDPQTLYVPVELLKDAGLL